MGGSNHKSHKSSINIQYKGCFYHSILELKFILLIEDKCSWIREPVAIHYDPNTLEVTNYINEKTKKYIPDFLVRKWKENTAHLIEIKPTRFLDLEQMRIRRIVTENYLKQKNVDWQFKVITEDDIKLNDFKTDLLKRIIDENRNLQSKLSLIKRDRKYNNTPQKYFANIPYLITKEITPEDYKRYVKYGVLPDSNESIGFLFEESGEYKSMYF